MKLISWNVNGFRACLQKGFSEFFNSINADIFCLQEIKMQEGQADFAPEGYYSFYSSADKKGYSGTAIFTKIKPLKVLYGIDGKYSDEGRIITLEFENCFVTNCYVPNAQEKLMRLDYRMEFEDDMRNFLTMLDKEKPVIYCGDLNVAHEEIDLKNPKTNTKNPGFSDEERAKFTTLLNAGFTDTFRYLHPEKILYSWWSYRFKARENNTGWRIDYFVISNSIVKHIKKAEIHTEIMGSDHCPVELEIDLVP